MNDANAELEQLLATSNAVPEVLTFYNGKETLYYNDGLHSYYRLDNGVPVLVAGVTTAIASMDKPALVQWAANMTSEYVRQSVPFVKVKLNGEVAEYVHREKLEETLNAARFNYRTISGVAKDVGKEAHTWLEHYVKGLISGTAEYPEFPQEDAAKNCIEAALDWKQRHNFRPRNSERKVFSREYNYAGTYDWDAVVTLCDDLKCCPFSGEVLAQGDYKSSKALYDEYLMQQAAYMVAAEEETGTKYDVAILLQLGKEDGAFKSLVTRREDLVDVHFTGFLGCLTLHNWTKQLQQNRRGAKEAAKVAKPKKSKVVIKQKIDLVEAA